VNDPANHLGARILIVDDLAVNILLLEHTLRLAGYVSVTSTLDARRVCGLHRQHCYDLILLDLKMPALDGLAVMDGLRALQPIGPLPVIVVTAQPNQQHRALRAGATDFVSKPLNLPDLLARVRRMLEASLPTAVTVPAVTAPALTFSAPLKEG
jgi:CheY-like chemotaxis protein